MKVKKRSVKTALELIDDDMVVCLGGGETIGYFVEYLSHSHKDVKVVTPLFAAEQACIRAGLELLPLWSVNRVDLSFGGCDEVDQNINALNRGNTYMFTITPTLEDNYIENITVDSSQIST